MTSGRRALTLDLRQLRPRSFCGEGKAKKRDQPAKVIFWDEQLVAIFFYLQRFVAVQSLSVPLAYTATSQLWDAERRIPSLDSTAEDANTPPHNKFWAALKSLLLGGRGGGGGRDPFPAISAATGNGKGIGSAGVLARRHRSCPAVCVCCAARSGPKLDLHRFGLCGC